MQNYPIGKKLIIVSSFQVQLVQNIEKCNKDAHVIRLELFEKILKRNLKFAADNNFQNALQIKQFEKSARLFT